MRSKDLSMYNGCKISLSKLQKGFFMILSNGKRHSSHSLVQQLPTSDARKIVQILRNKGINVMDEWVDKFNEIPRHKLYWINPDDCK